MRSLPEASREEPLSLREIVTAGLAIASHQIRKRAQSVQDARDQGEDDVY